MFSNLLTGLALLSGLTLSGLALAGAGKSCCSPASECCSAAPRSESDAVPAGCAEEPIPLQLPKAAPKAGCKCCADSPKEAPKVDQPVKAEAKVTKLIVDDMTCAGCAKTVSKALSAVSGVESAVVDLKTKTATVTPKADKGPSAKDLWEAVEKAGYKPSKLEGPDGKFEAKPTK